MMLGQHIINAILRPPLGWFLPYDVEGQQNLPLQGPVLVMMNHINFLDVIMPAMFLPRDVVMLSKIENFRAPFLGFLVRAYGSLPLRRGEADREAMRLSLDTLKKGQVLVIAPEGTRSGHGRLQPGHDGLAFVGTQANVPVVPIAMYGHERFWPNIKRLRRTPLHVRVGPAFRFVVQGRPRRGDLHAMTEEAMSRLAALMPPENRGAYPLAAAPGYRYTETCRPAPAREVV
jgi:1-acyl-sn-glycerol-3-phosphate acyltransferase